MNINDQTIDPNNVPNSPKSMMQQIFEHQTSLAAKYIDIERSNGFYKPDLPSTREEAIGRIDDKQFQNWIKNMFWRVTEEMSEAYEVFVEHQESADVASINHFLEEIIDALHFFVEVNVMIGFDYKMATESLAGGMTGNKAPVVSVMAAFIFEMGLAANCLKNKPWKVSQMLTDLTKFLTIVDGCWVVWGSLIKAMNLSPAEMYMLYMRKNAVNQFRQNTKY